jgi:hypothetical protein
MNTGEFKGEIMLYLYLLAFAMQMVHATEEKSLISPSDKKLKAIISGFKESHQLSTAKGIDQILKDYVTDACNYIPAVGYMTKNNESTQELQSALFAYYIEYQNHLLQPLRHPHNVVYKWYTWHCMRKAERNFKEKIFLVHKNIKTHRTLNEECDLNIALIQRLSKELVHIEKSMKKGDF